MGLVCLAFHLQAQVVVETDKPVKDTIHTNAAIVPGLSYTKEGNKTLLSTKIDFTKLQFSNEIQVMDLLQGRISGLDIIGASGNPGNSAQATLRGERMDGMNSPLIVIDGIPQPSHDNLFNQNNYNGEDIQNLLPVSVADILSVEVLKDGVSTALYGPEGNNGVILIETKKGKAQPFSLTYEFNQSMVQKPSFKPMLTGEEYVMYQLEAWHNDRGVFDLPEELSYQPGDADYYNYSANTNWLKEVTQTGWASNHHLNLSGGNKKTRYYASANYVDQKGTVINTGYNQLLGRLNLEHSFTKKLTLALHLNYGTNKYDGNVIPDTNNARDVLTMAFVKAPNMSVLQYDAQGKPTGNFFIPNGNYEGYNYYNPVAVSELGNSTASFSELRTTAWLQYEITKWFRLRESYSYNQSDKESKAALPLSIYRSEIGYNPQDIDSQSSLNFKHLANEFEASIRIPFKNENKNLLNGTFSWIGQNDERQYFHRWPYRINKNAAVSSIYYKLLDRYSLNVNTRMESVDYDPGKSDKNRHKGISAAWQFTNESFLKNSQLISNGLIHAGYSVSKYDPYVYTMKDYVIYDSQNRFNTQSAEAGFELNLFDNRLYYRADYYTKETDKYLSPLDVLKLKNKGWEYMAEYTLIDRKDLKLRLNLNRAHNERSYLYVPKLNNHGRNVNVYTGEYYHFAEAGESMGSFYGFRYLGVYASDADAVVRDKSGQPIYGLNSDVPLRMTIGGTTVQGGDARYDDVNHDGKIDQLDLVKLGNFLPRFTGGFGGTLKYKNLSLTCNFHYRSGYQIINQGAFVSEGRDSRNNLSRNVLNRWRVQGQQGEDLLPRASEYIYWLGSDRYVEDGDFFRLNYIHLNYQFNQAFCQQIKIKELALSLSAQRAYTRTNYSGLDPEITMSADNEMYKDQTRAYPPQVYTLSVKVTP